VGAREVDALEKILFDVTYRKTQGGHNQQHRLLTSAFAAHDTGGTGTARGGNRTPDPPAHLGSLPRARPFVLIARSPTRSVAPSSFASSSASVCTCVATGIWALAACRRAISSPAPAPQHKERPRAAATSHMPLLSAPLRRRQCSAYSIATIRVARARSRTLILHRRPNAPEHYHHIRPINLARLTEDCREQAFLRRHQTGSAPLLGAMTEGCASEPACGLILWPR
jgi:hypothetical protein